MRNLLKISQPLATLAAIALAGMSVIVLPAQSEEPEDSSFDPVRVEKGLAIAPVPLNYPASR